MSLSRGEGKGSGQRSENTEDMALGMGGESFSTAAWGRVEYVSVGASTQVDEVWGPYIL